MENITCGKGLLIIFLTNDNHISNIKTLQSIYKQDYPNIYLVVCNDCTDGFQSERLLYNFEDARPKNIRKILFRENEHPIGEYQSQKQFWDSVDLDYVITLHSGECFTRPHALSECIEYLDRDGSVDTVIAMAELFSDDMKKHLSTLSITKNNQTATFEMSQLNVRDLRDCMFICRLKVLRNLDVQIETGDRPVNHVLCHALLEGGMTVKTIPVTLCKFSQMSIQNVAVTVPDKYGNIVLENILELIQTSKEKVAESTLVNGFSQTNIVSEKHKNIIKTLYKYSRFSKLKYYAVINFVVLFCTVLLFVAESATRVIAMRIMIALTATLFIWLIGMVACNLYFKKKPQRWVF